MKYSYKIVLGLILLALCACNGNKATELVGPFVPPTVTNPIGKGLDIDAIIARRGSAIAQVSGLIPTNEIAEILGKTEAEIEVKDSSPRTPTATHSSTFFKWEDFEVNNAGVLLQILINPLGDEYPDYVPKFIDSKRMLGEQDLDNERHYFKKYEEFGDDGSYSYEAGKYFWRLGDKVIMSVAFNAAYSEEDQYRIATTIGKKMVENYIR